MYVYSTGILYLYLPIAKSITNVISNIFKTILSTQLNSVYAKEDFRSELEKVYMDVFELFKSDKVTDLRLPTLPANSMALVEAFKVGYNYIRL